MRGITMLAIGRPAFGKFAFNLAVSVRYHSPNLPIQLVHDQSAISHLNAGQLGLFNERTVIREADKFHEGSFSPAKAKVELYKYLKYGETIYLDVDTVLIKDIIPLFDTADQYYHSHTSATMLWAEKPTLKKYVGLEKTPMTNTSLQYIKKGKESRALFKEAVKNFGIIPLREQPIKWYKNGQPDELYMNIALEKAGLDPKFKGANPLYCRWVGETGKKPSATDIERGHYAISLWGHPNTVDRLCKTLYDKYMFKYLRSWALPHHYKIDQLLKQKV